MPLGVGDIPLTAVPGFMQGMGTGNALIDSALGNQIKNVQAQYAPLTTLSDAASKMAYANLMGPQFLAKLMGHPDVVANMTADQRNNLPAQLVNAGMGTGANGPLGNAFQQALQQVMQPPTNPLTNLVSGIKSAFGFGSASPESTSQNAMNNIPGTSTQQVNLSNMKPGDSYTNTSGSPQVVNVPRTQTATTQVTPVTTVGTNAQSNATQTQPSSGEATYGERAGYQAGLKAEGEQLGADRGRAIAKLGDEYVQDTEAMAPLQHLTQLVQTPTFMNMRNSIPGFQAIQMKTLANYGTPEQQRVIGDFITSAKTAVANTVNSFSGRAMAKEFDFGNMLKVNDNDSLGVIFGKLESLQTYKQATMQRNQIARDLMQYQHMNEGDAYNQANKQVNMDAIRSNIASQLQTPIPIINKKTGEKRLVSPKDYNDMLNQASSSSTSQKNVNNKQ